MASEAKDKLSEDSSTHSQMSENYAQYAKGGIVTKPTKAIIGEKGPEAVIPLKGNIKGELEYILRSGPVAPPKPLRKKRTLGDIYTALEAQRVFNPGLPSIPKPPSAPPANLAGKGTAPNMDNSGPWGGPAPKGER